ncbi:MAG: hypothetical protein AAF371_13400 [Pseudomonadota bacterium]
MATREVVERIEGAGKRWEIVATRGGPSGAGGEPSVLYQLWEGGSMKAGPFRTAGDAAAEARRRG